MIDFQILRFLRFEARFRVRRAFPSYCVFYDAPIRRKKDAARARSRAFGPARYPPSGRICFKRDQKTALPARSRAERGEKNQYTTVGGPFQAPRFSGNCSGLRLVGKMRNKIDRRVRARVFELLFRRTSTSLTVPLRLLSGTRSI